MERSLLAAMATVLVLASSAVAVEQAPTAEWLSLTCVLDLVALSPCFPTVATPPSEMVAVPSDECCNGFMAALNRGGGHPPCLCELIRNPLYFGFPVNVSSIACLITHCGSSILFNRENAGSLLRMCEGVHSDPPPLNDYPPTEDSQTAPPLQRPCDVRHCPAPFPDNGNGSYYPPSTLKNTSTPPTITSSLPRNDSKSPTYVLSPPPVHGPSTVQASDGNRPQFCTSLSDAVGQLCSILYDIIKWVFNRHERDIEMRRSVAQNDAWKFDHIL